MRLSNLLSAAGAVAATAALATAQGDMTVHRMGYNPGNNPNGFASYGTDSGIAAYSVASQSCNIGNVDLVWTSGSGQQHPVISSNVYRLKGRRFEQLGQSWLKHGFCALCESGCGPGVGGGCASVLRVGCADTYSAGLNDGSGGGPKFTVDAVSGDHLHPDPNPTGPATIRGRLQCAIADVDPAQNAGATYFVEGMYVHYVDHQNGFARNNATWREITFAGAPNYNMLSGSTVNHSTETIVEAWKSEDAAVEWVDVENTDEGGSGIHGYYQVAYRTWDNGDGTWEYHYLVNNQNSSQGCGSFVIPTGNGVTLSDIWFNDVDYHSGEPQDGTDWSMTQNANDITWECTETFLQNPDANAINWCTAYSFGFTANAAPVSDSGTITMFEPGVGTSLVFPMDAPGDGDENSGTPYCFGDGTGVSCPSGLTGDPGHGCPNSKASGRGAELVGMGNAQFSDDTFSLFVDEAAQVKPGLLIMGDSALSANGVPDSAGILCVNSSLRGNVVFTDGAGEVTMPDFQGQPFGATAFPAGSTTYYQFWFRDPGYPGANPGPNAEFNFSNGVAVDWIN